MNNELTKVFTYNESNQPMRVEVIEGEPWFVAKDICDVLGLTNSRKATSVLDDDERRASLIVTPYGSQTMTIVSESGLYNLIFQSRKPQAKAFRKWVTSEVLPAIRQTGSYIPSQVPRYPGKHEVMSVDLIRLLWLIGDYLNSGDQKDIAMELGVSTVSVNRVIQGKQRSPRILGALYERALRNRSQHNYLYSKPEVGIKKLME